MGKRQRIRQKAIGTAVGAVAVTPVAIAAPSALATYLIAGVVFLLSFWCTQRATGSSTRCTPSRLYLRSRRRDMLVPRQHTEARRSSSGSPFSSSASRLSMPSATGCPSATPTPHSHDFVDASRNLLDASGLIEEEQSPRLAGLRVAGFGQHVVELDPDGDVWLRL